ncbi:MAG: S8 family serine peptidase [Sporichthyaceae bacterium]|nr:S8 family serine peptidase [Sporichthyaceae bacterium]
MTSRVLRARATALVAAFGLVTGLTVTATQSASASGDGSEQTYIILYRDGAATDAASQLVTSAGGTLVANWPQIGVVVARSANPGFGSAVQADTRVEGAASTAGLGTPVGFDDTMAGPLPGSAPAPGSEGDNLTGLQWDMRQIHAFEAHDINAGSPEVIVGDIDTGLDFTHPDLAPNYSAAHSADCSSGAPQPLLAGNDLNGHGTHTAGTIAAAANGTGIVGVAPNVKIAGIKAASPDSFLFPEMVICAYMWVATHGIHITNNSYFADPWLFNCKNDPVQRAIWTAERRAIRFAQSQGTLFVASEGNRRSDLSHPAIDTISPDFPPGSAIVREITNACAVVPVEVPGVVGVTATGDLSLKSFYSDYGISTADVAAPGGDSILQVTPQAVNGRVLSTYPAANPCLRTVFDPDTGAKYCYLQGTSMAAPHAAGVAALIMSQTGKTGGALAAALQQATNPLPCPDESIYAPFPQTSGEPQSCQGGTPHNSFYGAGEVDALLAVS